MIPVKFVYATGIHLDIFANIKLAGSWDSHGRYSEQWLAAPVNMARIIYEDGCPAFVATVNFQDVDAGRTFDWGVHLDTAQVANIWGIPTEVHDRFSNQRTRSFVLGEVQEQIYYLTYCRRLGAQKRFVKDGGEPALQFGVWAPFAKSVEVVFGSYTKGAHNSGYISDNGDGIDASVGENGALPMKKADEGLWYTDLNDSRLARFKDFDHKLYMYRVTKEDGQVAYRTDLYSRCQIGKGTVSPNGGAYTGLYTDLDGSVSCSIVIDPETVTTHFEEPAWPETSFTPQEQFWAGEFDASRQVPQQVEEFIIYELHVGSLGFGKDGPGTFQDALDFLDHLVDLGVTAVELMPVLQFEKTVSWGYGTSHPFALEFNTGGRDQLKHLIRACHQRGIAVIMDVVYNHYHVDAERAEWAYDSNAPEHNLYYWYEGVPSDYPAFEWAAAHHIGKAVPGQGGYLDNYSTGYDPRFWEENLRKWFISSAVSLALEFHVDGFRVDLPQALYQFNVRHGDGIPVPSANDFGAKFLREWTRTMKMVKPQCVLIAEDHSNQAFVTTSLDAGGLGFDATWYSDFYHHAIGDGNYGSNYARLLYVAGLGGYEPLAMGYFAGALGWSGQNKVVYHEDHDDAGNAQNTARTMETAVNFASLEGLTRAYAEARCRCVCGLSMLSAGTPMFLMGEEIASASPMPYDNFLEFRDDFPAERAGAGRFMFKFYQDVIAFRRKNRGLRSHDLDIVHMNNANRLISFLRTDGTERFLIVASLNNQPFTNGYSIVSAHLGDVRWQEVFNSDAAVYGGSGVGNGGRTIASQNSLIDVNVPANGFVVFKQV